MAGLDPAIRLGAAEQIRTLCFTVACARLERILAALVVITEYDPLRDEGKYPAAKIRAAGTVATTSPWDGVNHAFFSWVCRVNKAGEAMAESCAWLHEACRPGKPAGLLRPLLQAITFDACPL